MSFLNVKAFKTKTCSNYCSIGLAKQDPTLVGSGNPENPTTQGPGRKTVLTDTGSAFASLNSLGDCCFAVNSL